MTKITPALTLRKSPFFHVAELFDCLVDPVGVDTVVNW